MSGGQRSVLILFPPSYFLLPLPFPPNLGGREARQSEAGGRDVRWLGSYFDGAQHERRATSGGNSITLLLFGIRHLAFDIPVAQHERRVSFAGERRGGSDVARKKMSEATRRVWRTRSTPGCFRSG